MGVQANKSLVNYVIIPHRYEPIVLDSHKNLMGHFLADVKCTIHLSMLEKLERIK